MAEKEGGALYRADRIPSFLPPMVVLGGGGSGGLVVGFELRVRPCWEVPLFSSFLFLFLFSFPFFAFALSLCCFPLSHLYRV